jgi:hypothetical protein
MSPGHRQPSRHEALLSWSIMGLLALIAMGVFIRQFDYDPSVINPGVPVQLSSESPEAARVFSAEAGLADMLPPDMEVMSPVESFGADTLSDKINGKAELYLSAGFLNLDAQRFVKPAAPGSWMEVFVYDMGSLRNAFAVYSTQKREATAPFDLTPFCTMTSNALYFVHGRHYVEIIASVASEDLMQAMVFSGRAFVQKTPVKEEHIDELALFPQEHLEAGSIVLLPSDAFGFHAMKNVFTGLYHVNGQELTAFVIRTGAEDEAVKLVAAYQAFLEANGGTRAPMTSPIEGGILVEIMETFELFFPHGPYVAGVHEAESLQAAETLAITLELTLARSVR